MEVQALRTSRINRASTAVILTLVVPGLPASDEYCGFCALSAYQQNDTAMRRSLIHNMPDMNDARLYVVATPIGNLEDITLRALDVLASVDVIAAEDTRRTRVLMSRHGLDKPLLTLQEHNEEQKAPQLVERLGRGESIALVSDAGTPLLSDPGFRLVRLAAEAGIEVVTVPGPVPSLPPCRSADCPRTGLPSRGFCRRVIGQGESAWPRSDPNRAPWCFLNPAIASGKAWQTWRKCLAKTGRLRFAGK